MTGANPHAHQPPFIPVYDKSVRRRRITVALLVACSLLLLTAYFGESAGGGLHSVQRGVLDVVSPIQEGASRALKPVRDLAGWFGDTLSAKSENGKLKRQNQELRRLAIAGTAATRENRHLQDLLGLDESGLAAARPVSARVIGQSPTIWYSTIGIDKGTGAGVRVGQPVITGDGLIGQVTESVGPSAIVTLITDSSISIPARVNENGVTGVVQSGSGGPEDLRLKFTGRSDVAVGNTVVTAGTAPDAGRYVSLYPPDIGIGVVTRVDDPGSDSPQIHIRPFADLKRVETVQVLTRQINGNRG